MASRQCYHCKEWIEEGEPHDCWTTTEAALTRDLSEDLQDAWERLRETAVSFGEQRIYASHHSIMFSRSSCYFFVRPKRKFLEVSVFLGRTLNAPQVRRAVPASRAKVAHLIQITHRDQVEAPITDWLAEAYELSGQPPVRMPAKSAAAKPRPGPGRQRPAAADKPGAARKSTAARRATAARKTAARKTAARKAPARRKPPTFQKAKPAGKSRRR